MYLLNSRSVLKMILSARGSISPLGGYWVTVRAVFACVRSVLDKHTIQYIILLYYLLYTPYHTTIHPPIPYILLIHTVLFIVHLIIQYTNQLFILYIVYYGTITIYYYTIIYYCHIILYTIQLILYIITIYYYNI